MPRVAEGELLGGDIVIRGDGVYKTVPGNAGMHLHEVGWSLVGITGVVKNFKLASPMIVWRWVRAGLPCVEIAGRKVFDLTRVAYWLETKGYDLDKLEAGMGPNGSRVKHGQQRWRKGQMSPAKAGKPVGQKRSRNRKRGAR
jgi:hypothetical protein